MKTSTRLASAATVIALILYGVNDKLFGEDAGPGLILVLIGIWALKFILGSMIDKKAETKE